MLALTNIGCTDDEIFSDDSKLLPNEQGLGLQNNSYDLTSARQSFVNEVTGISPWAFSNSADWISLSPTTGTGTTDVTFNVSENTSALQTRTNVLYLKSTDPVFDATLPMSVSQGTAVPYITPEVTSVSFSGKGGSSTVRLSTNIIPNAAVSYYDNWISAVVTDDGKSVVITVQPNETTYSRRGTVRLEYMNNTYENISISQAAPTLNVSEGSLTYENTAGTYRVKVNSDVSWSAYTSDSWIDVSTEQRSNTDSLLDISVSPNTSVNSRTGYVTVAMVNGNSITITIVQRGIFVEIDGNLTNLSALGETREISIASNVGWTAISPESWIIVNPTNGEGNGSISVTAVDNPSLSSRIGHVIVQSVAKNASDTIIVSQRGKTFSVDSTLITFNDKGGTSSVGIHANHSWTASLQENYDWLSIDPTSGEDDAQLQITATENNTTEERTGYINVVMYNQTYTIAVHQMSKYFIVNSSVTDFTSHGGSSSVDISSNDNWTVNVEPNKEWLSSAQNSGYGNANFDVSASDNPSITDREAYVDFTSSYSGVVRINYKQAARYLYADRSDFTFFGKGGNSDVTTITTDGTFKIEQEGGWFIINRISENTFTVTATQNTNKQEREGKIIISLTDLTSGTMQLELPVRQLADGATFTKGDFTADVDWSLYSSSNASISIVGFSGDRNWSVNPGTNTSVNFVGYTSDSDWNVRYNNKGQIIGYGFTNDANWNKSGDDRFNGNVNGYSQDSNWNFNDYGIHSRIIGTGYGPDKDWNNNVGSRSNIGKTAFDNDSNWNK